MIYVTMKPETGQTAISWVLPIRNASSKIKDFPFQHITK